MRSGLTGLGLVFVATLTASVLFAPTEDAEPKEPSEPLAQLGVAPGPEKDPAATFAARTQQPAAEPLSTEPPSVPAPDQSMTGAVPMPQSAPPERKPIPNPSAPRDSTRTTI